MPFWFALLIFCVCWIIIGTIVFVSYRFMKKENLPSRWRIVLSDKEFTLNGLFGRKRRLEEERDTSENDDRRV